MWTYDLHVHSAELSPCGISSAESMCTAAVEAGLSGIALTDHDVWWQQGRFRELCDQFPRLTIFPGCEIALPEGHFLVFLPQHPSSNTLPASDIDDLCQRVHAKGGIVIWAHPYRFDQTDFLPWVDRAALDGVEVISSNMNAKLSTKALEVARRKQIMRLRNSDAHDVKDLGCFVNFFKRRLSSVSDLIGYVREWNLKARS